MCNKVVVTCCILLNCAGRCKYQLELPRQFDLELDPCGGGSASSQSPPPSLSDSLLPYRMGKFQLN